MCFVIADNRSASLDGDMTQNKKPPDGGFFVLRTVQTMHSADTFSRP